MTGPIVRDSADLAQLYGLRLSLGGGEQEPPKLRDLVARALELGYAEPEIDFGDGNQDVVDEAGTVLMAIRVPMARVQLHSNSNGLRNVVGHCEVLRREDGDVGLAARLAARSALAEALLLAEGEAR